MRFLMGSFGPAQLNKRSHHFLKNHQREKAQGGKEYTSYSLSLSVPLLITMPCHARVPKGSVV